jgi:hypothetical protein
MWAWIAWMLAVLSGLSVTVIAVVDAWNISGRVSEVIRAWKR